MAEELTCPECGKVIESTDDVEHSHEIVEMDVEGSEINPYTDKTGDLYLCKGCKRPLGIDLK